MRFCAIYAILNLTKEDRRNMQVASHKCVSVDKTQ